jgi:hypothetical protein
MDSSIYPLTHDRSYTFGELRAAEKMLLAERQADQALSSQLRLQDRKQIEWAKIRNEEWSPLKLLADERENSEGSMHDGLRRELGSALSGRASLSEGTGIQCKNSISEAAGFPNLLSVTLRKISSHGGPELCRQSNPN